MKTPSVLFLFLNAFLLSACNDRDLPVGCRIGDLSELTSGQPHGPSHVPAQQPQAVRIDPQTLRVKLLEGETTLMLGLNRLHQAKDQVRIARGNLLPSFNLGTILGAASGPGFLLGSVDILLPFLLPAKWFDFFMSKQLFEAEKAALLLLQMNEFASAYSLYYTVLSDQDFKKIYEAEASDLQEIFDYIQQAYRSGIATVADLDQARGQLGLAKINVGKIDDALIQEVAAIRHVLALQPGDQIEFARIPLPFSDWETRPLEQGTEFAVMQSVESLQLDHLGEAANLGTWSKVFSFLTGADLKTTSMAGGQSVAFSKLSLGAGVNLGFAYWPMIELSQKNGIDIGLRRQEVRRELTQLLEGVLGLIAEAKNRTNTAVSTEAAFAETYQLRQQEYKMGALPLTLLLQARSQLRQGSLEVIRAQTTLELMRVVLHRMMRTDQFTEIHGCEMPFPEKA